MADVVDLRSRQPISHEDEFNSQLVQDLARYSEGLETELNIRKRYQFDDAVWESLGSNEALFAAISDEKTRRIRSGQLKRERSQVLVASGAIDVLGEILLNKNNSPKHRIDSCKVLNDLATDGPAPAAGQSDRFIISINLSADGVDHVLHFDKPIKPNTIDGTQEFPAITANKSEDGSDGEPV